MPSLPHALFAVVVTLAVGLALGCRGKPPRNGDGEPLGLRPVAAGHWSGVEEQRVAVVRDEAAWRALWSEHTRHQLPPPPPPAVDFEMEMVLAVFLGECPSGGYGVVIDGVEQVDGELVLRATATGPGPDQAVTMAMTSPAQFVAVPRREGVLRLDLTDRR